MPSLSNTLIIALFSISTFSHANNLSEQSVITTNWVQLSNNLFLDEKSIKVNANPKIVQADVYVTTQKSDEIINTTTFVECETNMTYSANTVKILDKNLQLKRIIKNDEISTKNDQEFIVNQPIPLILKELCSSKYSQ